MVRKVHYLLAEKDLGQSPSCFRAETVPGGRRSRRWSAGARCSARETAPAARTCPARP